MAIAPKDRFQVDPGDVRYTLDEVVAACRALTLTRQIQGYTVPDWLIIDTVNGQEIPRFCLWDFLPHGLDDSYKIVARELRPWLPNVTWIWLCFDARYAFKTRCEKGKQ